jgi:hypothetical protein
VIAYPVVLSRLAGAILAETAGQAFLLGNTKMPADFPAAGFVAPAIIDALATPALPLVMLRTIERPAPRIHLPVTAVDPAAAAAHVAGLFVIERNGSVSDRLWRLVLAEQGGDVQAAWLGQMPIAVWQIVRDTVLRCS